MAEIPVANIYYLLCYAWDVLDERDSLAEVDAQESTELLALFARVLNSGTRRLLRRGLDRGYLQKQETIAGIRGKMVLAPTLRGDLMRSGRAVCEWDELEYNTLPNQLIKTTLEQLHHADALAGPEHADLQEGIRDLLRWLRPIEPVEIRSELLGECNCIETTGSTLFCSTFVSSSTSTGYPLREVLAAFEILSARDCPSSSKNLC